MHVFLRERRDEILRRWEALVLAESRPVNLTGLVLRNSVPQLLDELAGWLESGEPAGSSRVGAEALGHVLQRLDAGLDLAQVLREYRLLRESLLRVVLEAEGAAQAGAGGPAASLRDLRVVELARLNAGLDVALSDSVGQFVAERDRRAALQRQHAEALSSALGAIDLAIHASHDLGEVIQAALREATAVLGTETAALSLREGDAWIVRHVHGLPADALGARMADDEEPHAALALREQRPVAIPDAWNDPRVNAAHMRRWNVRAVLVVPLFVRGEAAGVVFFNDHRGPRELGPAEVDFGAKFGATLSLAIDNARMFAELREADRAKTEFLAVVAHELRNALAPIRNSVFLLERGAPDGPTGQRAKEILRRQTDQVIHLVDDLLDLSRITHQKMRVQLEPHDACELVRRAYVDAKPQFEARDVELMLSVPSEPLWVAADAARFAQMIGNLLHNALKFTRPRGLVQLKLARLGAGCEVTVKDDGQGLAPADLERIFDPFEQAARARDGSGGLGLGLALVKRLAVKHHGTVQARSEGPGKGAELVLQLPLLPAPPSRTPAAEPRARAGAAPLRIVVVEDNEDAGETLAELLALGGHHVTLAANGKAGVAAVARERPDVLICDVGLPDMSGYAVIQAIRAGEQEAKVFAVALTGYAQPQDRAEALAAGFDAHLSKPPPLDELDELLASAARPGGSSPGASP